MNLSEVLERELKKREILRLEREDLSVRLYNPWQVLILGIEPRQMGSECIHIPLAVSFDLRSGHKDQIPDWDVLRKYGVSGWVHTYPVKIFQDGMTWLQETLTAQGDNINKHLWLDPSTGYLEGTNPQKSYPELLPIVNILEKHFKEKAEAKIEVPFGHVTLKVDSFNPDKARREFRDHPDYLPREKVITNDGPVILIRPDRILSDEKPYTTMEVFLFNPLHYQEFVNGTRKVTHPFPSLADWIFDMTYGRDPYRRGCPAWLHFNPWSFDTQHVAKEGLLDDNEAHFFMNANESLAKTVESIACLPLGFLITRDADYRRNPKKYPNYSRGQK